MSDSNDPTFRTIDMSAEAKKLWGAKWGAPEVAYEFGGRKFELRTGDAAIYETSPDFD
jgi:hypothetical protein